MITSQCYGTRGNRLAARLTHRIGRLTDLVTGLFHRFGRLDAVFANAVSQPPHVDVNEILVRPTPPVT